MHTIFLRYWLNDILYLNLLNWNKIFFKNNAWKTTYVSLGECISKSCVKPSYIIHTLMTTQTNAEIWRDKNIWHDATPQPIVWKMVQTNCNSKAIIIFFYRFDISYYDFTKTTVLPDLQKFHGGKFKDCVFFHSLILTNAHFP